MGALRITYSDMLDQFKKICSYYFFDENFQNKMLKIIEKIETLNADKYAQKYEEETDEFVHKIARHVDGDRRKSIKLINEASEEILATLIVRLITFDEYCQENPNKEYFMFGDTNNQLVIECLINFWRAYNHKGPINFVV
ncbi:MAG: hypothetical protein E7500_00230 [Ruminococcus sp.]|nr:hypothetical protein [Ruminococcus sp.]